MTKNTGYYNQKEYTSLRTSLEKCELNSIIKLKKKVDNKNLFDIGSKVSFWNTIRKAQQKNNQNLTKNLSFDNVKQEKPSNVNEAL